MAAIPIVVQLTDARIIAKYNKLISQRARSRRWSDHRFDWNGGRGMIFDKYNLTHLDEQDICTEETRKNTSSAWALSVTD
jgi:hypothetical protein